ncbi:MAG: OmpA family protein [Gammaproteobacteria bacterium]
MKWTTIAGLAAWTALGTTPLAILAQGVQRSEAIVSSDVLSQISMFSYKEGPKSELLFRGTPIAAKAQGSAQVEYQDGNARISARVDNLPEPSELGPYTTYVLWALTPDGRATNQGVISGDSGGKGRLDTKYSASQFALVVTAEPHFAVTMPSTMIALYNVADNVKGVESKVTTLTERANYSHLTGLATNDRNSPLEVVQARYSIAIARAAGADRFASPAFASATQKLAAAETALRGTRSERKAAPGLAREAVIAGEDARRSAMLASAAANAEAQRQAAARDATETERGVAAVAAQAASTAATAAAASTLAATEAATARAATEAATARAANEAAAASTRAATEAATASTLAATDAAAASARAASDAATETERLRTNAAAAAVAMAAREELRNRLNAALPTRESNRGLVSEIGGVQFATAAADVNAAGRESLAKFSGVVASYPTLRFNIEGHTDSVGSVAANDDLSLRRAMAVRNYLIGHGVVASSIDVAGLGSSSPLEDNSTADGRARNRRVEIVLSGGPLAAR